MTEGDLERATLQALATRKDNRPAQPFLKRQVIESFPDGARPSDLQVMAAFWTLVSRGLVFIDMVGHSAENWSAFLTKAGVAALGEEETNPDLPSGYFSRLSDIVPTLGSVPMRYLREAVSAYIARAYLASDVMLGVATEAVVLEIAPSFARWLPKTEGEKLSKILASKQHFSHKLDEIKKRLEVHKSGLPDALSSDLDTVIMWTIGIIRSHRNDAGHPTDRIGSRADSFIKLHAFPTVAARLYELREFFERHSTP